MEANPNSTELYVQISNEGDVLFETIYMISSFKEGKWINDNEFISADQHAIRRSTLVSETWCHSISLGEYKSFSSDIKFNNDLVEVNYNVLMDDGSSKDMKYKLFVENGRKYISMDSIILDTSSIEVGKDRKHVLHASVL